MLLVYLNTIIVAKSFIFACNQMIASSYSTCAYMAVHGYVAIIAMTLLRKSPYSHYIYIISHGIHFITLFYVGTIGKWCCVTRKHLIRIGPSI